MNTISMELHQEQITDLQSQVEELESEKHCLEEELEDLKEYCGELKSENEELETRHERFKKDRHERFKKEIAILKRKCKSYEKASQTVLSIYNEDIKKMDDLQKLNNKLVKSCKKANRDFFILAAAYVATLMLMIYLFIR